ncbi:Rab5-interacting protein-domain-containing protein [Calycina marina]|uniref:ER membrane protein complex subunit 6 n=1 Tax=Calycina marina TaxID=1763456 RepID=A0A9P7YWV3_9HELO|nr:Rab5-interacting protein-domain-containing protein [Calycina marina]
MRTEQELQISPVVQESVIHNTKVLVTLRNLTASLFGIGAGILGLESYPGFIFYVVFSLLTSALVYALRVQPALARDPSGDAGITRFFKGSWELWTGGIFEGLSGFVLTWTLFYGLVRA